MCGIHMHARNYHGVIVCAMAGIAAAQGTGEQLEDGEIVEEPEEGETTDGDYEY